MKKSFILFFLMMFALSTVAFATDNGKVKINYQRKNKDYTNMTVWAWEGGKEPTGGWPNGYEPKGKNAFGVYYEVPLVLAAKKVGFLLVNKKTEVKDVEADRSIDLSKGKEVWILEGDEKVYYSNPKK